MEKLIKLQNYLEKIDSVVIAFSGGVDSTFLARVAGNVLGEKVLLVTAKSTTYPERELEEAKRLASAMNLEHMVIVSEEIGIPGFSENPPDRCYYCKRELFLRIKEIAIKEGYDTVMDGSNSDDLMDYRPGRKALTELGILSPLLEIGFTKEEIRRYSFQLGLNTASKPSFACLASRFPYGESITADKLKRVGTAEEMLVKLGFKQFRVRSHGNLARIEIAVGEMDKAWQMKKELDEACRAAGFVYISLDLRGYRTGAMNEVLTQ